MTISFPVLALSHIPMPELYLFIVVLLFVLAISDLIVGVSNDAVNFLNSAIGSRVASRNTIMIVASLGIFVGATFSSGMMEVARKGIFNPQFFVFSEIMVVFLAVMLTDIILLDLFNTFGMPTSTTVSIVFELLGAAVAVSLLKINAAGDSIDTLVEYINTSSALAIISGIFLSVGVAFAIGALLQYLSRLLFTFEYQKRIRWVGAAWGGLALTILTFFLIFKGAKGASFISDAVLDWIKANTLLLLGISLVFWITVMQLLLFLKVNILRVIVLFGTFSLAMAFAGNDLVNFIGVPIAGFESYVAWAASGDAADTYSMEVLQQPVRTRTYMLLLAGLIMIITLWLSKKSRSVTETEVNLGRQSEGSERFSPNLLARGIVWYTRGLGAGMQRLIPDRWLEKSAARFAMPAEDDQDEKAAFDLVRAAVNLTVASMLISFATSLKLPLSTTYVSFMVAMGTSLADRAWGRESAVYRVAGVLNVIGGWFGTAFIAFTVSATFAWLIYSFGIWAIGLLVAAAVFFISRTFLLHQKQQKRKAAREKGLLSGERLLPEQLQSETASYLGHTLTQVADIYQEAIRGLLDEDTTPIGQSSKRMSQLLERHDDFRYGLMNGLKRVEEDQPHSSQLYLLVYDLEQDLLQSTQLIVGHCRAYVANSLPPLAEKQRVDLSRLSTALGGYLKEVGQALENPNNGSALALVQRKQTLLRDIEGLIARQVTGLKASQFGHRNSMLYFSLQLESKDVIAVAARFVKLYKRVEESTPLLFKEK